MKLTRIDRSLAQPDSARKGYFDGEVKTLQLVGPNESNEVELLAVYFSAGARTRPHTHEQDQILQIIEGQGIVATETEKLLVAAGDGVTIPAGSRPGRCAPRGGGGGPVPIQKAGRSPLGSRGKELGPGF